MIQDPQKIKQLSVREMELLAEEIRQKIISVCMKNGGHLGSSLGAVELAIALHASFDSPKDAILWDVGHQAYAHKMLTGRWSRMDTLRCVGGIAGFPARDESEHDVFGVGHSSTSITAASAIAWSKKQKKINSWTLAVIGDGGLSAGLAFEGLNNLKNLELGQFLIILNDNHMSISKSEGAIHEILSKHQGAEFFGSLGLDYYGPIDGHHFDTLLTTLASLKNHSTAKPMLLHVLTQKGRGYLPAEESPAMFHGVGPIKTALEQPLGQKDKKTWSEVFGKKLCELAAQDKKIVAITAAMPEGTGLLEFAKKFPDRFFDVGIAEPQAITFAAGLATQGYRPVVAIYSTFLQRAQDSIIHDVALQQLGVTLAIDRAGLVGGDGATHHGIFDIAQLKMIPGFQIYSPATEKDLKEQLENSIHSGKPSAIRYPRGECEPAIAIPHVKNPQIFLIAIGTMLYNAVLAANQADPHNEKIQVISLNQIKPIDSKVIQILKKHFEVPAIIIEPGILMGGVSESLTVEMQNRTGKFTLLGIQDHFIKHGSISELEDEAGISVKNILREIQRALVNEKTT